MPLKFLYWYFSRWIKVLLLIKAQANFWYCPSCLKNEACFINGQKWLKNNYLDGLVQRFSTDGSWPVNGSWQISNGLWALLFFCTNTIFELFFLLKLLSCASWNKNIRNMGRGVVWVENHCISLYSWHTLYYLLAWWLWKVPHSPRVRWIQLHFWRRFGWNNREFPARLNIKLYKTLNSKICGLVGSKDASRSKGRGFKSPVY